VYGYAAPLITDPGESVGGDGHKRAGNVGNLNQSRQRDGRLHIPLYVRPSEVRVKFGVNYRPAATAV
jgi:hypothetical protein